MYHQTGFDRGAALPSPFARDPRPVWALLAAAPVIFALATWDPVGRPGGQDFLRLFSIPILVVELIVIGAALSAGCEPLRMIRAAPRWMQAALALLVGIAFGTALLVAPDQPTALVRTCSSMVHLLFGLSVLFLLERNAAVAQLIWPLIVAGTCGYALVVGLFISAIESPATYDWEYFRLGVVHLRQLGFYSAVGAAAALGLAAAARQRAHYLFWFGAAAFMLALSFWSGTRGSLVAVAAAFALAVCVLPAARSIRAIAGAVLSFPAGALLSLLASGPNHLFGLSRILGTAGGTSADQVSSGRLSMWSGTFETYLERPLFGLGESQFRIIVPQAMGEYNHPHNLLLQILLQWGLVGAICFFTFAAVIWYRSVRGARTEGASHLPPFLVLNSLLIMALFEGSFYHGYPVAMIALSTAFLLHRRSEGAARGQ